MLPPYIGLTGFTNQREVELMYDVFQKNLKSESERLLHVGVMMSYETLRGIETKWSDVFPKKDSIISIFSNEYVFNCLHFVDRGKWKEGELEDALRDVIWYSGSNLDAIQLDMVWPAPLQIAHGISHLKQMPEVILQIGQEAFKVVDDDPIFLCEALKDYRGVITRVLLDKSMGKGIPMNAYELMPFVQAIKESFPDMGITVAGGLGPETVQLVQPLLVKFPDLSFDAEGKLRRSGSNLDPVDWDLATEYLERGMMLAN